MNSKVTDKKWLWTDEYLVSSYEVNANGKAPLPVLGKFLQETAYNHAGHLEFGYHQLKEKNLFWVLSRLSIRIDKYPKWGDKIRIRTWPSGVERLFAYRDFQVLDEKGVPIGAAGSAWLMLDAKKHRPQRHDDLVVKSKFFPDQYALAERPGKISPLPNPDRTVFFPVRYSDLDLYDHVNNSKYIEWILDTFPGKMHREYEVSMFEINFLSEAKLGDEVAIQTGQTDNASPGLLFHHRIEGKADNRDICLAKTGWRAWER